MPTLADVIRRYEQLLGGTSLPELRKFHAFLKSTLTGGGPPPKLGLAKLALALEPKPGFFRFNKHFSVMGKEDYGSVAFIERLNRAFQAFADAKQTTLPAITKLVNCGDFGCAYRVKGHPDRVYKIIPQRIQRDAHFDGAYYDRRDFAREYHVVKTLSGAQIGPALYGAFVIPVPLRAGEKETFEFELGNAENVVVYVLLIETLRVLPGKGIQLEKDSSEVAAKKQMLLDQAGHLLKCDLDMEDAEWGYAGDATNLANLRLFDTACKAPDV